jgi:ankyrin repeat protein
MSELALKEFLASCADVLLLEEAQATVNSVGLDGDTPIHVALWQDKPEILSLLITAGADVNATGDMSETPLHVTLHQRHLKAVKELLSAGANPEAISELGRSPKQIAFEIGGEFHRAFMPRKI